MILSSSILLNSRNFNMHCFYPQDASVEEEQKICNRLFFRNPELRKRKDELMRRCR